MALQCFAYSGVYDVTLSTKKQMEFTTTSAIGHLGSTVVLKLEKNE